MTPESSSNQPPPDPLIDEVRAIRKAISDRYGNDVRRLGAHLQEFQKQFQDRLVSPEELARSAPDEPESKRGAA